jgi:transposase
MVYQKIDPGQKLVAARLFERGRDSIEDIADVAIMSRATVYRSVRRYRATGSVIPPKSYLQGRPRALDRGDLDYVTEIIRAKPTRYLREMQTLLVNNRGIDAPISTLQDSLERLGITHKKLNKAASERDYDLRAEFQFRMGEYHSPQLVFLDESSKDDRMYSRLYGRAAASDRAVEPAPFIRGDRYSLLPAMSVDGIFTAAVVKGSFNRRRFVRFLEDDLVNSFLTASAFA